MDENTTGKNTYVSERNTRGEKNKQGGRISEAQQPRVRGKRKRNQKKLTTKTNKRKTQSKGRKQKTKQANKKQIGKKIINVICIITTKPRIYIYFFHKTSVSPPLR